ncbi:hypothetical protein FRC14_000071 [Serendipita sp. 396]|nr:hypothetical protein FRC14_000071 [Serendipita sp. 396]KAG8789848.1 hypothetical protein FRC15_000040 [Serendipita sp. 397]KAG8804810.1 hypothetical protein FRC16_000064 [Serendipita sp. 398]KAG8826316.1 hypothetical protein FRC19_009276 [Serendipita sp. 401]KAG8879480.1 hypothetical protein FRC20_000052 [Serendipita sp. 405]KAG9057055.1 hypothetical protein FS842_008717 [Serendipita sp. 407]
MASGAGASFSSLPVELQIAIIEELYEPHHMRSDAAWEWPYHRILRCVDQKKPMLLYVASSDQAVSKNAILIGPVCSALKSLRLVSRSLNALCAPLISRELDAHWLDRASHSDFDDSMFENAITFRPEHVRSIRIHTSDSGDGQLWADQLQTMAILLSRCNNVHSIAIYYDYRAASLGELWRQVMATMQAGNVTEFGLYSISIMESNRAAPSRDYGYPSRMSSSLLELFSSKEACKALQSLDLVMAGIAPKTWDAIQVNLPSLRSLTIRRALRSLYLGGYEPFQMHLWGLYRNMTRIQLIYCEPAHADLMVDLVRHFPALEELVWASCGSKRDSPPPLPPDGWSKMDDALCNLRPPLRELHIQHALDWELGILGQIPAVEVIIDNFDEEETTRAFSRTKELYLGMRTLHVLPKDLINSTPEEGQVEDQTEEAIIVLNQTLDAICAERQVTLLRDATVMFECICCSRNVGD